MEVGQNYTFLHFYLLVVFIIWLAPCKLINWILSCDWLLRWARWCFLEHSGLTAVTSKKILLFCPTTCTKCFIDWPSFFGQDGWALASCLFCKFIDFNSVSTHKHAKKDLADIQASCPHTWSITHGHIIIYSM